MERRMHSLRSDFGRLLRVGPSGRGADGEVDPSKFHMKDRILFNRMSFLKDHIRPRETKTSCKVTILT